MKTILLVSAGLCLAGGIIVALAWRSAPSPSAPSAETSPALASDNSTPTETTEEKSTSAPERRPAASPRVVSRTAAAAAVKAEAPSLPFQQALATLVSGQSTFLQRQAALQQIKDAGKLDQLITELEQGSTSNPSIAEYPAALGQAYLQKAGTLQDIREQGILGMKADQSFDAALNLDPSNWDAGFWKAMAMSYWPPQLGKGPEVIQRLVDLVKLQEGQQLQPHFVQTYVLLGEQYQKQGYADYARQIWQRGAALFPNEAKFADKLNQAQPQAEQAAAR